jgi:alpha-beta hydrolase superfamily lysophospholipase
MATFPSRDGTTLHEIVWPAAGTPRGALAIVHGYFEHAGRYDHVGKALAARGWNVHGLDFRGHGQSGGLRGHVQRFDEYLDDIDAVLARARLDKKPLFLVAHSMGGLAATEYVLHRPHALTGLVLSSPWYRTKMPVPAIKVYAAKALSSVWPTLSIPGNLKGKDCTRDPEKAAHYDVDPLGNKNATARWFTESLAAQADVMARAGEVKLPLLVVAGGGDLVADCTAAEQAFAKFSSVDKTLRVLPEQYHEVFNEPPGVREQTIEEVAVWLDAHIASPKAPESSKASEESSEKVARS